MSFHKSAPQDPAVAEPGTVSHEVIAAPEAMTGTQEPATSDASEPTGARVKLTGTGASVPPRSALWRHLKFGLAGVAGLLLIGVSTQIWRVHRAAQHAAVERVERGNIQTAMENALRAQQETEESTRKAAAAEIAARKRWFMSDADHARLTDGDYKFTPIENPDGKKVWLFGYQQENGAFAFDLQALCSREPLPGAPNAAAPDHRDPEDIFGSHGYLSGDPNDPKSPVSAAVTLPARALARARTERLHLPQSWTVATEEVAVQKDMTGLAKAFHATNGPCGFLLTAPFAAQKEAKLYLRENWAFESKIARLALAYPGEALAARLKRATNTLVCVGDDSRARELYQTIYQVQIREGSALLKSDPQMRAIARRERANQDDKSQHMQVDCFHEFRATLFAERGEEEFRFYQYRLLHRTFWVLVRSEDKLVMHVDAAGERANTYFPELYATMDADGDGIDELVVRAILYEGTMLKLLKIDAGKLKVISRSSYSGV